MRRLLDPMLALAVALPLLTALALVFVSPREQEALGQPPTEVTLERATTVCPSALGAEKAAVLFKDGEITTPTVGGALVETVDGGAASGLLAGRFAAPTAIADCGPPAAEQWFTGLGAGARHRSLLELVNPDSSPAVADVVVYGRNGVIDAPRLRGVALPAGGSVRLDLAEVVPRRDELALRVMSTRGRVAASVLDRFESFGGGADTADWLPAQEAPGLDHLLLGLPEGRGQRTLVLANPGSDEVRATVRLVSEDSVFAPVGLDDVRVQPGSVSRVRLTDVLTGPAADGVVGVLVESTAPVTAGLRSLVGGDLVPAVAATAFTDPATTLVPPGAKRLVLAGAVAPGVVSVVVLTADGEQLPDQRVEVGSDRGIVVRLPRRAAVVTVTPERTPVVGVVLVDGRGYGVARLRPPLTSTLVPDVRAGLP